MRKILNNTHEIDLENCDLSLDGARAAGEALKKTTKLKRLSCQNFSTGPILAVLDGLCVNESVSVLKLRSSNLSFEAAKAVGSMLSLNKSITYLDMSACEVGERGASVIAEGVKMNHFLKVLILSQNQLGAQGALFFSQALACHPSVLDVYLDFNQLHDEGSIAIANMLASNTCLTRLNVARNDIGSSHVTSHAWQHALETNTSLRHLNLAQNGIDLKCIANGLMTNHSVTHLDVSENKCRHDDDVSQSLCQMLKCNTSLRHLSMSQCHLNDQIITTLSLGLMHNQTLTYLDLLDNPCFHLGLLALAHALKHNCTVGNLFFNLDDNNVSEDARRAIVEAAKMNGAATLTCSNQLSEYCQRNRRLHARVRDVAICVLCIGRYKRASLGALKDVMKIIAQWVWKTRADLRFL